MSLIASINLMFMYRIILEQFKLYLLIYIQKLNVIIILRALKNKQEQHKSLQSMFSI